MTYKYCVKVIDRMLYPSKELMLEMLDVFMLNQRITKDEYTELSNILDKQ